MNGRIIYKLIYTMFIIYIYIYIYIIITLFLSECMHSQSYYRNSHKYCVLRYYAIYYGFNCINDVNL